LNAEDLAGTKVEQYLEIAVKESSPEIYKPRQGKANGNMDKYNKVALEFIAQYSWDLLYKLNYNQIFEEAGAMELDEESKNTNKDFILKFNE